MREAVAVSRVDRVELVADLLEKNQTQLPEFLTHDPQGRHMVAYLSGLAVRLEEERTALQENLLGMARQRRAGALHRRPAADPRAGHAP